MRFFARRDRSGPPRRFTERFSDIDLIAASIPHPLPLESVPSVDELRTRVEQRIDDALAALDDGHARFLDEWLRTQESNALAALEELIAQQDRATSALINRKRCEWERAEHRFSTSTERLTRLRLRARSIERANGLDPTHHDPRA